MLKKYRYPLRPDVPRAFKTQIVGADNEATEEDCAQKFKILSGDLLTALNGRIPVEKRTLEVFTGALQQEFNLPAIISPERAATGKLRLVCDRLSELRSPRSRMELIWEALKNCLTQTRSGLRELRTIRKQVERYAQRQLKTTTLAEALDIIYNEFSTLITRQCYRELIHARLPERLREAMEGRTELEQDGLALQRLHGDYLRTNPDAAEAM